MPGRRSRRATGRAIGAVLATAALLSARPAAGDAEPDPGIAIRRQAELDKVRGKFEKQLGANLQAVATVTAGGVIAVLDVRPFLDLPETHAEAAVVQASLMERLLRGGFLAMPYERERKIDPHYAYQKLPKGMLASAEDAAALVAKGTVWLLVTRLLPDEIGSEVVVELYDLRTAKRVLKSVVGPLPTKKFTTLEIWGPATLPPRNLRLLLFAMEHLGQQVDRGECWDVPAVPIHAEGGHVEGYDFGTEIPWSEGQPGDVVTFGTSGDTGGHVVLLFRWAPDRNEATIFHQNWGGNRRVTWARLPDIEGNKPGQALRLWRP